MSQRHRRIEAIPPPREELRAHAHNERHRIHSELHLITEQVQHGIEPEDIDEPGTNWKPLHHHNSQIASQNIRGATFKHWKAKSWKRRKAMRRARIAQISEI
ncbi:MAG: hypothetical protein WCH63_07680 [Actinomycetota bacterium]